MKMKRAVMMAVLVIALAALALPIASMRSRAAGTAGDVKASAPKALAGVPNVIQQQAVETDKASQEPFGKIDESILRGMGIGQRVPGQKVKKQKGGGLTTQSGTPVVLNAQSALSAALLTNIGGRDTQFSEVTLIADWDGREDCVADREQKIDDFSGIEVEIDQSLTRTAISEHTYANGFNENVYYYADSLGNIWVGVDTNPGLNQTANGAIDTLLQINLPNALNAFGTINGDDQVTITGLSVNPVADLTSFANVNGSFAPFAGQVGEILYVSYWDSEGGLRLSTNNQLVRGGVLAFPIADLISPAAAPPGVISPAGFPVQVGGAFGVAFTTFSTVGGLAVDDDGSVYFHQADLLNLGNGANIVKIQSLDTPTNQDRSLATNGFLTISTLNPTNGLYGNASGPANQINRFTNYSGTSTTFGNIVSLASGSCNTLYAAVAASFVPGAVSFEQLTQGLYQAPSAFASGTPSMIISFADCSGAFDACTGPAPGIAGTLPIADGFADVAQAGVTRTAGVNNFRIFALGNGPDIRPAVGGTSVVPGTPASVLKIDMQIDYTSYAGISVNQEGTVFVISGGTPAGIGKNPSPMFSEILCFEDACPMDRRGDFVDLRGNANPNPPASGGNVGDGDSDRFDHIWYQAPFDQVTITPTGLSGLAGGHLLYTNRTRTRNTGSLARLPNGGTQGDDSSSGVLVFEDFDAGHQVAGGDDQNTPFRGDDDDGAGSPSLVGPLSGGFEFIFGATGVPNGSPPCAPVVWNGFFLNSNGSISFGAGDTSNIPTVPGFRSGLPKIAPAWSDLNPAARAVNPGNFPVQALGFANVNAFRIRWINVPEFGFENCTVGGSTNTFGVTLYDDGTGIDENANQPLNPANPIGNNAVPFDLQEGPTDLRFVTEPNTGVLVGCSPRRQGSGHFVFDYCRMDLLGTGNRPVLTGYSIGGTSGLNPPGLCETNLSEVARAADNNPFGVINGQTASIQACLIGEGTEPHIFEFFNDGRDAGTGSGGEITFATPDFDLRFEGNDAALCTPIRQRDLNRGKVGFFGVGCPLNPVCLAVTPVGTVVVAPNQPAVGSAAAGSQLTSAGARIATPTSGIINAICNVQLNYLGCWFIPNEVTTICQGFSAETGVPLQRPGKTVTSALRLGCDTNGDGLVDSVTTLTGVNPLNINLVRGTLSAPAQTGFIGTAFPLSCCGGLANLTLTTTFTAGDNNIFGAFALTANCTIDLGVRAPVVISITPSSGDCSLPVNDLLISGGCFILPGFGPAGVGSTNVTSVFAIEQGNPANVVQALRFVVLSPFLINVDFAFTSANAGKTFLIFVSGPNGTSQNLTSLPAGTQGCPAGYLGNQLGIQVTFKCNTGTVPGGSGNPNAALITSARWEEGILIVEGDNIHGDATASIGTTNAKKIKYKGLVSGSNNFRRLVVKGLCPAGTAGAELKITQSGVSSTFRIADPCPVR